MASLTATIIQGKDLFIGIKNFIKMSTKCSSAQVKQTNQMLEMTKKGIENRTGNIIFFLCMKFVCLHLGYSGML